jgi:hypothetical protein
MYVPGLQSGCMYLELIERFNICIVVNLGDTFRMKILTMLLSLEVLIVF